MAALLALSFAVCYSVCFAFQGRLLLVEQSSFGTFQEAARLAILPQGWVSVIDRGDHSLLVFKEPSASPVTIGGFGWEAGAFDRPSGIATDGINLFVSDYGNHRIQRFDRNLNFISTLATRDTMESRARFGYPLGVAVSRFGDLFVLDGENLRVAKFHVSGRFERSFGDGERAPARLAAPVSITLSLQDRVLILERDRILEYDYFGNLVRRLGEGVLKDAIAMAQSDSGFVVVTATSLVLLSPNGAPLQTIGLGEILTSPDPAKRDGARKPLGEVRDIIVRRQTMWLLTRTACFVFEMKWR